MAPYDPLENASPETRQRYLNALARRKSKEASFRVTIPPSSIAYLEAKAQQAQSSSTQLGVHWENTKGGYRGFLFFFCFSLIFMMLGIIIPVLTDPTGLQARFTGIQTTALVTAAGECGNKYRGNYFTYTFVDSQHQVQHITNDSLCLSGIVSDGDRVTIWYQQDHPSHLITANFLLFDLIFLLGFSSPLLLFFAFCCVRLVRGPRKHLRQVHRGNTDE